MNLTIRRVFIALLIIAIACLIIYFANKNTNNDVPLNPIKEYFETSSTVPNITLSEEQIEMCPAPQQNSIIAVRSLYSGATFKLEIISFSKPNEVFICGPGNFVVELVDNASNSLKLAIKERTGRNTLQKFVKSEMTNETGNKCVTLNAYDTNLYLQYEHEHLSLRPLNSNSKPFMGQCFVDYNATPEEIESNSLALGISKVGMDGSVLIDNGITETVDGVNNGGGSLTDLQLETERRYADALYGVVDSLQYLSSQLKGDTVSSSPFGNKDAIKINVDLSSNNDEFSNISKFQDIASSGSGTATVVQLLDQYLGKSGLELGNVPGISGSLTNNGLLEIKKALQNKFKGCPALDRNLFYTERQLAQCSGCNPDEFLRGQLGGMPKTL